MVGENKMNLDYLSMLSVNGSVITGGETQTTQPVTTTGDGAVVSGGQAPAGGLGWWIWPVYGVLIAGMYFFMIRPQKKREKQIKEMQSSIKVGDSIVTNSGMYGKVTDLGETCFVVEFGINKGVKIPINKENVMGIKTPEI